MVDPTEPGKKVSMPRNFVPPGLLASRGRGSKLQRIGCSKSQAYTNTSSRSKVASSQDGYLKAVNSSGGGCARKSSRDYTRDIEVVQRRSIIQGTSKPPGYSIHTHSYTQRMPRVGSTSVTRDAPGCGAPFNPKYSSPSRFDGDIQFSNLEMDEEDDNISEDIPLLNGDEDEEEDSYSNEPLQGEDNSIYEEDENTIFEEDELQAGNENDIIETLSMGHEEQTQGKETEPSRKRKKQDEKTRGKNKCKDIAKLRPGQKLQVTFYNNRAVGENHNIFARHLGIIVRDTNICPVRVRKWADIGEREKTHMWTAVTDVFTNENMETYREHALDHMHELWLNWRSDLLRNNVKKKGITLNAALKIVPPGLDAEEWKWLIKKVYSQESFKKASERNSKNRKKYPKDLLHTTGSKPYRQLLWNDMGAKDGNKPSLLDVFRETHKKGEKLPNAHATQKCDEIRETMEKDPSLSHIQVAEKVFESKSRGRVIGFGGGVKPKDIRGPYCSRIAFEAELTSARQVNKTLLNRINFLENANQELNDRIETMEVKLRTIEDLMSQKFDVSFSSPSHSE